MKLGQKFLPVNLQYMKSQGFEAIDFLLITGDAYVDHPSFGVALIGRVLESAGYCVGVLAQPNWKDLNSFKSLGRPNLAVLVTSGNLDSMVANYTAAGKPRREDDYSPGSIGGMRPDRAVVVYANRAREAFPGVFVIIGGLEASLRRLAHFDYWSGKVRRSILLDSKADLLLYGMSEYSMLQVAERLQSGQYHFADIPGAGYLQAKAPKHALVLPSYEVTREDKAAYATAFKLAYAEQNPYTGKALTQQHGDTFLCLNPPPLPLSTAQMDFVYDLPFVRQYHPNYIDKGGVKALEEVQFSITAQRGCFGSCSFCALTAHQGRQIQRRSMRSILAEATLLTTLPEFKGYIHDIGGPTANFYGATCEKPGQEGPCRGKECLTPDKCRMLKVDHTEYLEVLRAVRKLPGVKKVFIRSGVRFDYVLQDSRAEFINELCQHHISGQLKIAPEHVSPKVLKLMGKPARRVYEQFAARFNQTNQALGKEQYLVPYFISSHPGSTLEDAVLLAEYLRDHHIRPEQVQDFIPTPGSMSTCMYYTGIHPLTGEKVYVPTEQAEKKMQRALLQYFLPQNHGLVRQALQKVNRADLVGYGPKCLVPPARTSSAKPKRK